MQFNVRNILLLATAVAAIPTKRDVNTVLANLESIDSSTNSLTASINSFNGDLTGALAINTAATNLETTIDNANTEAKTEPVESSADSQTVLSFVTGTLTPDIAASLDALVAKKADFTSLGLQGLVLTTLETLQTDSNSYSASLANIASADQKSAATAAGAAINADFNTAIAAYS